MICTSRVKDAVDIVLFTKDKKSTTRYGLSTEGVEYYNNCSYPSESNYIADIDD